MTVDTIDVPQDRRAAAAAAVRPRDHVVALPGNRWSLWRSVVLRGAGFPAALVLGLSSNAAAAAANRYAEATAAVDRARKAILARLSVAIATAEGDTRRALRATRRRVQKDVFDQEPRTPEERALAPAIGDRQSAHDAFVHAYEADAARVDAQIVRLLSEPRFAEAALWQNHRGFSVVRRALGERPWRESDRRHAGFVAMLVQRYAVKNDSIGFFGPVGWASLSDDPPIVDVVPGEALLARRQVYFEGWCIDALAETLNLDPAVRPWTAPRRKPGIWLDAAGNVYAPLTGHVALTAADRCVFGRCDGTTTAREIAYALVQEQPAIVRSEAEVFDILERLVRRNLVAWRLDVAPQLHPERELQARIDRIGDPAARETCAAALASFVTARDRVANAAGRPEELEVRLCELDDTFSRCTGRPPGRHAGQTYAARGLVYEDCRRAGEVTLGRDFLARLGPPLEIVLDAAHWATAEFARLVRQYLRRRWAELAARQPGRAIDAHLFFHYVLATPDSELAALSIEVKRCYQERWQSIAGIEEGARRIVRPVVEAAERARRAFRTDGCSWSRAWYFGPDIMVAAEDLAAFRRGRFQCVLGEVHSTNSLLWSMFVSQHPDAQRLGEALTCDARHLTMISTQEPKGDWTARLNVAVVADGAWRYEFGDDRPSLPSPRSLPAAMLVAVDDGEMVRMRARDGSLEFDALELFGALACRQVNRIIESRLPEAAHAPRVTIGDLTVCRETWYVTPAEMPFLAARDRPARFAEARAWARERQMPRYVFYKSPAEVKPCYLDFDSAIYVEAFVKLMRHLDGTAGVRVAEMLPAFDGLWLEDGRGSRYTAEFRFAAQPAT